MDPEFKDQLIKRVKSLSWRAGMMVLAGIVDFVLQNMAGLHFPHEITVFVGLGLGELSKYLNSQV